MNSNTNDWIRVSNTAWLDLCLGWEGLCIEPSAIYHANIRSKRTCELVPTCLSFQNETVNFSKEQTTQDGPGVAMECVRLDHLLRQRGIRTVHLWSLDIEGFEDKALAGVDFSSFDIQTMLIEQQELAVHPCQQISIDYLLTLRGYSKYRINSDAFYVKPNYGQTYSTLRFPNATALTQYFKQLEDPRCQGKLHLFDEYST